MMVDDPAVAAVQAELERALPFIKGAKDGLENVVGGPVGVEAVLFALFIAFCGRGVLQIADKLLTHALAERTAEREARQEAAREARARAEAHAARAMENAAPGLRSGVLRVFPRQAG